MQRAAVALAEAPESRVLDRTAAAVAEGGQVRIDDRAALAGAELAEVRIGERVTVTAAGRTEIRIRDADAAAATVRPQIGPPDGVAIAPAERAQIRARCPGPHPNRRRQRGICALAPRSPRREREDERDERQRHDRDGLPPHDAVQSTHAAASRTTPARRRGSARGPVLCRRAVSQHAVPAETTPEAVAPRASTALSQQAGAPAKSRRAVFIDVLRLVASVQMVMGHTVDGLMLEELRAGPVFDAWTWGRGLTSVAFMVAAGMSYHLSTIARFERHKRDPANGRRRIRRGLMLIAVGYLLHLPLGALSGDPATAAAAWRAFATPDVLQCIGISLLALEGMTTLARRPGQVVAGCAVAAVAMLTLAPLTEQINPSGPFFPLLTYLGHQGGALFPLLPWSGFVFAGVVAAHVVVPRSVDRSTTWRALACASVAFSIAWCVEAAPALISNAETSYSATPALTTLKLAVVLAIVALIATVTVRVHRLPRPLEALAGESLVVYVSHLLVLYSAGIGIYSLFGHSLALPAAVSVGVVLAAGSALFALAWHRFKQRRAVAVRTG